APFIRGVLLLHSFEYQDAARAFREAQRLDAGFALAYWGEALTYTHPLWNEQDRNAARAALQRLGPTAAAWRSKAPTPREQAYLDAVAILYGAGAKAERDTAYSAAMGRLVNQFPADREAKVFYALSLLGLNQGVRDTATYMRAAAIVEPVFRANPNHPGAAHVLIHCYDDPIHAPLGLAAARAYSKIAPDAAHAQHMTTHIFLALGMWDEVVSQNEIASGGDRAAWTPHHYTEWLGYGYLQQGRYQEALQHLELMHQNMNQARRGRPVLAEMRADYVVNTERWDSPCLQWSIDLTGVRARDAAVDVFVAGLSALKRGDRRGAERGLADRAAVNRSRASVGRRRRRVPGRPRYAPTVSSGRSGTGPTRAFLDSPRRRGLSRHGRNTARPWRSRSGFRPDRDDAAARVAADELPRRFGRTAVDLDTLDVLGRRVAREVRRRLVAVEEVLRVAPRRRADHLGDAV